MKKIIAAIDGLKYSDSTTAYAVEMAKKFSMKLFGVFLEDVTYHSYKITDLVGEDSVEMEKAAYLRQFDADTRENSIKLFDRACQDAGIVHATHRDRNVAIQELLHESLYSDLVIIQNNETLTHYSESAPTEFIRQLLERSECPVLVVPPAYKKTEKVIFLYNGEPSSIYAIKQFASLFPDETLPTELVTVKKMKEEKVIPDNHLIKEWFKLNYPHTIYHVLPGDPEEQITRYIKEQTKNVMVVLGAYQRGSVSRFIHKSMADDLMNKLDIPVFIAHK